MDWTELSALLASLVQPSALKEWGLLLLCLGASWLVVRVLHGRSGDPRSILFGARLIDGVLFPTLALVFALVLAFVILGSGVRIGVFKLAIPILVSLALIRLSVRVLTVTFPEHRWVRWVEQSISWMAWGLVVLWVTGLLPLLMDGMEAVRWKMGGTLVSLFDAVVFVLASGFGLMLALWAAAAIEARLTQASGDALSIRKMAANLIRVALLFIGLIIALSTAGIDLTALGVFGGAIGVGLGFGLQKITANYVSGFVILAERSLRIGDMVKVDGFEGCITDIRTRYTVIRSLTGRESVVPNETLITQRVENMSLADPKVLVQCPVGVAYGTDVRSLMPQMQACVEALPRVLSDPGPGVQLLDFGPDGLLLSVNFWIRDPENGINSARSEANLVLLDLIRQLGVEIPYPQRVLHWSPSPAGSPEAIMRGFAR